MNWGNVYHRHEHYKNEYNRHICHAFTHIAGLVVYIVTYILKGWAGLEARQTGGAVWGLVR